jgi:NAD(P)H-nitrite reductase large subunit
LIVAAGVRSNVNFLEGSGIETDKFGLLIDTFGKTNCEDIYGAGDVTGRNPIWPTAAKEAIIAASNMAGVKCEMTDFFASKSTMNFLDIPTMSLGINEPTDDTFKVEIQSDDKGNYKKIIHKDGKIYGAIIQGDLSYTGVLTQLIKNNIDISKVKKPIFKIDYSDFFNINENFEFTYEK